MALKAGTKLGHYEVVSSLGAGGMGEVYRAKGTKLGREVAIKLLLEEVSQDAERRARFERKARVLASLNHNNTATLHGFERDGDTSFLVMELVDGETLADRIARGPISVVALRSGGRVRSAIASVRSALSGFAVSWHLSYRRAVAGAGGAVPSGERHGHP